VFGFVSIVIPLELKNSIIVGKPTLCLTGELNVGLPTIIEFLSSKGITIDTNPNTKLDKEYYAMLCDEFAADQDLKEKSKGVITSREKRESLSIEDSKKECCRGYKN
jgi:translation initiation factor IF-2